MTLSMAQQQSAQPLLKAVSRVRVFLGITQELVPLHHSQPLDTKNSAISLISTKGSQSSEDLSVTTNTTKPALSENEQDQERAWIVSSLLQETSASGETTDYQHKPVRVALESVLRWIRSSHASMTFSTIISLVDVITAWIASSSSSPSSSGDVNTSSEETRDILESMLVTLTALLVAAYTKVSSDDEEEELGSLVASVVGQMAAYSSDTSIPEPIRLLAIGVASTLLGECFVRFKFTDVPFLIQEPAPSGSPSPVQLAAYERFLRLVTSDDVWDILKTLSTAPGAVVGYLGARGSSPIAAVATHAFLSHEMASTLQTFAEQPVFTPSTTESSCRDLERRIVREAVAIHGHQMVALFISYGKRLFPSQASVANSTSSEPLLPRDIAGQIRTRYQLDQLVDSGLDDALSHLSLQAGTPLSPSSADKTRYPVPSSLADYGWYGTTVLRQILINIVSQPSNSRGAKKLLQDSPYSPIYIGTGLLIVDTDESCSSVSITGSYIEQRLNLGDASCLDTMINIYLSMLQQVKDEARVQSLRRIVHRALIQLITTANRCSTSSVLQLFGSIQKPTWIRLGADCHNAGFGSWSKAVASPRDVEGPLKLLEWIHQQKLALADPKVHAGKGVPLLWTLFDLLYARYDQQPNGSKDNHSHHISRASDTWPLHLLLRSYCPEMLVVGCIAWFRWYNASRPFPIFPKTLAEALDYGLQTQVESSTKAIQSLFQTMIASKFHTLDQRAQAPTVPTVPEPKTSSSEDTIMADVSEASPLKDADARSNDTFTFAALTETMTAMYWSWSDFVDEGHSRSVPKLAALFQAEWTADAKVRSKKAAAEARGVKRSALMAGSGEVATANTAITMNTATSSTASSAAASAAGAGMAGKGGKGAKLDAVFFKKTKSASTSPFDASPSTSVSSHDSQGSPLGAKGASKQVLSSPPLQQPLQLVSSGDLVAQIKAGKAGLAGAGPGVGMGGGGVGGTGSSLSNMQNVQQAKVSNPLWAPVLGLSHVPQMQARHQTHVQLEVQRWMALLAHMDGPTFSEHLTGLIKAVYPSDQKFLLDQVLVELMALEDSAQNETIEGIKHSLKESRYYFVPDGQSAGATTTAASQRMGRGSAGSVHFTTEWIVETVIGALVNMVIKPEEQPGYMEPGSLKWTEPVAEHTLDWKQILDAQTVLEARSSPLLSKTHSTASSQSTGRYYSVYDLQSLAQEEGFVLDPSASADTLSTISQGPNALGLSSSPMVPPPTVSRPKAVGAMGGAAAATTKKRRMRNLYNRRVSPFYATLIMFQRKWTTSGHGAGMTFLGPASDDGFGQRGMEESTPLSAAALAAGGGGALPSMDELSARDGIDNSVNNNDDDDGDDDDDESDEAMLRRAQQAEKRTLACQAPIRTLLVILQTLTKMNQGGALDAWIVDALSGTIDIVQSRFFEWAVEMLRLRVALPTATPTAAKDASSRQQHPPLSMAENSPFGRYMTLEQGQAELLRLLPVLTAATGIGMGPLQRAYQRSVTYHKKAMKEQQARRAKSERAEDGMAASSLAESGRDSCGDAATTTMHWRQLVALLPAGLSR